MAPMPRKPLIVFSAHSRGHHYVVAFEQGRTAEAIQAVTRWKRDPELPLSTFVAARLITRIAECSPDHMEN